MGRGRPTHGAIGKGLEALQRGGGKAEVYMGPRGCVLSVLG